MSKPFLAGFTALAISLFSCLAILDADCAPLPDGTSAAVNCVQDGCPELVPLTASAAYSHEVK
jgi:hypothetical protein